MLLHKLLQSNPKWMTKALYHGWLHPVMSSIEFHEQGTPNAHVEMIWDGPYRLRFKPKSNTNQDLILSWVTPPPLNIAGKHLTHLEFRATTGLDLDLVIFRDCRIGVQSQTGSLELPGGWDVEESHAGLFNALRPRTFGYENIDMITTME